MCALAHSLKISALVGGICLAASILIPAQAAQAALVYHNGATFSDPAGTGEVDVLFSSPVTFEETFKVFYENAQHELVGEYDTPDRVTFVCEFVENATTTPWYEYEITLLGADFAGPCSDYLAPEIDPVEMNGVGGDLTIDFVTIIGSVNVASSVIHRDGENATLNIFFDDYVDPGETFGIFFKIRDVGVEGWSGYSDNSFAMAQRPFPVPEPATMGLLALGGLSLLRRRRR